MQKPSSFVVGMALTLGLTGCDQQGWCERFNLACDLGTTPGLEDPVDEDGDIWEAGPDCDDTDPLVHPSAEEVCDGIDNNCDGQVDEGTPGIQTWYIDQDFDGWGTDSATIEACEGPTGYVLQDGDCSPSNPAVNPGATERCGDGVDNDCDGQADICYLSGDLDADDANLWLLASTSEGVSLGTTLAVGPDPQVSTRGATRALAMGAPEFNSAGGGVWLTGPTEFFFTSVGAYTINAISRELAGRPAGWEAGRAVALPGDLTGDTINDFAVGMPGATRSEEGEGAVLMTAGPTAVGTGRDTSKDRFLVGAEPGARMGSSIAGVQSPDGGALNGLLAGAPGASDGRGAVVLIYDQPAGVIEPGDAYLRIRGGEDDLGFGETVTSGDLDGDGIGDLVAAAPDVDRVYVFLAPYGSGEREIDRATLVLSGDAGGRLGQAMAVVPDLDDDGYAELLLGSPDHDGTGAAWLVAGGRSMGGNSAVADTAWASWLSDETGAELGASLAGAGRFTPDGDPGILLGAPGTDRDDGVSEDLGAVWIITDLSGGTTELTEPDDAWARVIGLSSGGRAGQAVAVLPDVDGNNLDEIVIGVPGEGSGQVLVLKAPGR